MSSVEHHGPHYPSGHAQHDHDHGHAHDPESDHDHDHDRVPGGWWHRLRHAVEPHSHDTTDQVDSALESSRDGMRAVWISLAGLGLTGALQAIVVVWSGSVALLGDTLHNVADALTAVPLGIAFLIGRRPPTRRYTYGFGRAEDLAGIVIVLIIAASAVLAGVEAVRRLLHPADVSHLVAVAAAGAVGFAGNELVAQYRIRVGRRIGSAALVADGLHARTDGFTSLGVLVSAGGVALGWRWADPVVGLAITAAIVAVLAGAARQVYRRLMDAVDADLVDRVEAALRHTPGVLDVGSVQLRWIGHRLRAECEIVVDAEISLVGGHAIAVDAEHNLLHAVPRLGSAIVHADPQEQPDTDHHAAVAHHHNGEDR
jgi:cation diffusion facilitator family transporter